eukprot:TRINITY_DN4486_c0_g1_i14.p1 TRINITY_DN4486_c0_g1~~TRINITY_DN4486_c0_g1_i14.p1  ORF type:complete len:402 (+),score=70.58 TRINITY_DN4486_c0_g1_i14:517-1722(+)
MENKVLPDLNMPVPTEGTPVLLKVYDEDTIKLNTLIEVVGILSPMDPDAVSNSERDAVHEMFGTTREEIFAHSPPSSLVPRLHAVFITKLGEANPLVQCQLTHEESIEQLSLLQHVRELLLDHMAKSLGGDRLAAEYLFLQLTSRVYARSGILPLGTVLLNLTHWKCNQVGIGELFHRFLLDLVPRCHLISLSVKNLNSDAVKFRPRKDYNQNRLVSGQFQLPNGTVLILDETSMDTGVISQEGLMKLKAVDELVRWQKVDYDFEYHVTEFHTSFPIIILSVGRSLFSKDNEMSCHVPVRGEMEFSPQDSEALVLFRKFLGLMVNHKFQPLNDSMIKLIQDDFVKMRSEQNFHVTSNDLHIWLTFVRYYVLSFGENFLTRERWQDFKDLEIRRFRRLRELK